LIGYQGRAKQILDQLGFGLAGGTQASMALSHKLELRQSQSLVMTPQLMQAIKLLQLSNLDLMAYVEAELERNPLLERADHDGSDAADTVDEEGASPSNGRESANEGFADAGEWPESHPEPKTTAMADGPAPDLGSIFAHDDAEAVRPSVPLAGPGPETWVPSASRQASSAAEYTLEAFVAERKSLADHLHDQLGLATSDPALLLIGRSLIDEIDEAGYLRTDLGEAAERLGAPLALVESAHLLIQSLEPVGVGARTLAECLALQLRDRDRFDPAMQALIANLDLVARYDHSALRRLCEVDEEDLADMLTELRSLDPKPGHAFGSAPIQPVIPDVLVRAGPDGAWLVELNSGTLPKVLVNQRYYASVAKMGKNAGDKAFLVDCLQTANWLVKSLDQRARTILKVATEIVRQQDAFLAGGVTFLRPLNLKTIADAIAMHESTVSRVTSNKYIATPRGIFEMKYFFTAAIASSEGGEAHSAEAVRFRIRRLIEDESEGAILSDDAIVKILGDAGVDIARRTVAKYREAMRIPSSVQRRREKRPAS
jgi:RNA polymerase sigma-54 factor